MEAMQPTSFRLSARGRVISSTRPLIMGILNINDDSFCGDGSLDADWANSRARELAKEGADIIDVGGESARTNRPPITEAEEIRRVLPFVRQFAKAMALLSPIDSQQIFPPLLSVNTWRPAVAGALLAEGGDILNDMSGLPEPDNARICANAGAALVIMHTAGDPKVPHNHLQYRDVMADIDTFFTNRIQSAIHAGLPRESIILDPGIDFAKQPPDNLRVLRDARRLTRFGLPVLLPISRKGTIGKTLGIPQPAHRDPGTVACLVAGQLRGASIFRVHAVKEMRLARNMIASLREEPLPLPES